MHTAITSSNNPLIKRMRTLQRRRGRRLEGLTLVEGPTVFSHMAAAGVIPEIVLATEDDDRTMAVCARFGWAPVIVTHDVLVSAGSTVHPQSPIAAIPVPEPREMRAHDTLVLVDVSDPGNVGTMIRSAAAFGWDVCVSQETADPWSPKVLRSSAGTAFGTHLSSSADPVSTSRGCGLEVLASVVSGGVKAIRNGRPIGLMIGSEAHGLPGTLTTRADREVTITTQSSVESLNAAVAASILMHMLSAGDHTP